MDLRQLAYAAIGAAVAVTSAGCAGLLGLDAGTLDDGVDASAEADGAKPPDAIAAWPDAAASDAGLDASGAADGRPASSDGASSSDGACAHTACPSGCVDVQSDPRNCGGCGHACTHGANSAPTCKAGTCGLTCLGGYVDCAGKSCSCGGGQRCLSDDTCGACRSVAQPCHANGDCCSGTCAATLTCL